jgi:quercetin dioxygenase-like cupin family protein
MIDMFRKGDAVGYKEVMDGIMRKTLVYGDKTTMAEFKLAKGSLVRNHQHPGHEQTGYLIKGKLLFYIGTEKCEVDPGDSWCVPVNIEHRVEVLEDSVAIEVFSPIKKDFI